MQMGPKIEKRKRGGRGIYAQVSERGRIATYEEEGVKWGPLGNSQFL